MGPGNYAVFVYSRDNSLLEEYHFQDVYVHKEDDCIKVMNKKAKLLLLIHTTEHTVIAKLEENTSI